LIVCRRVFISYDQAYHTNRFLKLRGVNVNGIKKT
jgi:hypothetical protein